MKAFFSAEEIVEALYEGILGREADAEGLSHHAAELRRRGPLHSVRALLGSEEFRHALGLDRQQQLTILGNCNAPVLADCLRAGSNAWVRWVADVNHRGKPAFLAALAAIDALQAGSVISVPFGEDHPDLSTARIKALYGDRFFLMTNIHFTGLHPDLTYFGGFGGRVHSPIGEYNSRIVLSCYLRGMSRQDCLRQFNGRTYEKLGYFSAWEDSAEELRRRDRPMDITFADAFLEMTRHEQTLYSINHPTSIALVTQAESIARKFGLATRFAVDSFYNPLVEEARWPIYPEIREAHRLPYETEFRFHGKPTAGPGMDLADFIAASYNCYDAYGHEALRQKARRNDDFIDRDF